MKKLSEQVTSQMRSNLVNTGVKISREELDGIGKFTQLLQKSLLADRQKMMAALQRLASVQDPAGAQRAMGEVFKAIEAIQKQQAAQNPEAQPAASTQAFFAPHPMTPRPHGAPDASTAAESLTEGKIRTEQFVKSLFN